MEAFLTGRDTYDVARRLGGGRPYPGGPTVVVTTGRPLGDAPAEVSARSGDLGAVVHGTETASHQRVWIEGGGRPVRDLIGLGELDVLETAVIPIVPGIGVLLFPDGIRGARPSLGIARP